MLLKRIRIGVLAVFGFVVVDFFLGKRDVLSRQPNEIRVIGEGIDSYLEIPLDGILLSDLLPRIPIPDGNSTIKIIGSYSNDWENTTVELADGQIPGNLPNWFEALVLPKHDLWIQNGWRHRSESRSN